MNDALLQYLVARADLVRMLLLAPGILYIGVWAFFSIPPLLGEETERKRLLLCGLALIALAILCPGEAELYQLFSVEAP